MSSQRRSSLTVGDDLGKPFQVYAEIINAGKNVQGTKRRIKWRFAYSNKPDDVHEIDLMHSLASGKRTIYENGNEISSSTNMLATDFSYGWTSQQSHVYRIEANYGFTTEHTYIFSIDGVRFTDLPRQPEKPALRKTEDTEVKVTPPKRISIASEKKTKPTIATETQPPKPPTRPERFEFQSPISIPGNKSQFDTFGDDPFKNDDPFEETALPSAPFGADPFNSTIPVKPKPSPPSRPSAKTAPAPAPKAVVPEPDFFDSSPAPAPVFNDAFDPFVPSSSPAPAPAASPDFFSSPTQPFDPFAPASTGSSFPNPTVGRRASAHDILMHDFSGLSMPAAPVPAPAQVNAGLSFEPSTSKSGASPAAGFSGFSGFDGFASPSSFEPTAAPAPAPCTGAAIAEADLLSEATKKLVSLDLSGKAVAPAVSTEDRRANFEKRLSLNELMPGDGPQRRSSMKAGSDMFGAPTLAPQQPFASQPVNAFGGPPVGGSSMMGGPMQPPFGVERRSSMGGPMGGPLGAPSMMGGPMGGPFGGPSMMGGASTMGIPLGGPSMMGSSGGSSVMGGGGSIGSMGGSSAMGGGALRPLPGASSIGISTMPSPAIERRSSMGGVTAAPPINPAYQYQATTAPKSSLDSLDWKS